MALFLRFVLAALLCVLAASLTSSDWGSAHAQTFEGRTCGAYIDTEALTQSGVGSTVGLSPLQNCQAGTSEAGSRATLEGFTSADEILAINFLNTPTNPCGIPALGTDFFDCGVVLAFGSGLTVTENGGLNEQKPGAVTTLHSTNLSTTNVNTTIRFSDGTDEWTFTFSTTGTTMNQFTITKFVAPATTTTTEAQRQASGNLVQNRNNNLQNLQPNIGGFIDGTFANGGGDLGQFALRGNEAGFNMALASSLGRVLSSKAKNEVLARHQIAQDRANNELNGNTRTSAFLYGQSVPTDADGVTQTSGTTTNPISENNSETATLELDAEEQVYGSSAGAQEVANTSQLDQARERGYDMWVQIYGAKAHAGNSDSTLWVGYAGAHGFVNDNLIIGGLVQLDWVDESNDTAGSSADGFGWMVGPYIAAKLPDQNLFFDARAAYGRSDNDITLTTSTGSFQTERWLVSAKVSGLLEQGDIEIRPAIGVSYFEETQESYTDSTNTAIGSQTFTQGEIRFGPTFAKTYYQNDGTRLKPRFGINGVWNFSVDNGASTTAVLDNGDLRARLDIGVTILGTESWNVDLSGFYDGIGINNYYAYGGKARLTVPLN